MPSGESLVINGEAVVKKVKELIEEGNIRKITFKDKLGKVTANSPFNVV